MKSPRLRKVILFAAALVLCGPVAAQVAIREFLANYVAGLRDETNEHEDWIEIENTSASAVALSGWYLTDDATRLRKWPFPSWTIGPGRHIVVFASNRDRRPPQAVPGQDNAGTAAQPRLATNFRISSNAGCCLALTKEGTGGVVEVISGYNGYPKQVPDVSYGPSVITAAIVPANAPVPSVAIPVFPMPTPCSVRAPSRLVLTASPPSPSAAATRPSISRMQCSSPATSLHGAPPRKKAAASPTSATAWRKLPSATPFPRLAAAGLRG